MKKINVFLGMFILLAIVTSCVTESPEQEVELETFQKSAGFDAGYIYFESLKDEEPTDGLYLYDKLDPSEKAAVWVFKYSLFKNNAVLNNEQSNAIDDMISFYMENDFKEEDVNGQIYKDEVFDAFDPFTSNSLVGFLNNDPTTPPTETDDKYTGFTYELKSPCHEEFVNGESIGFYESITVRRYVRGNLKEKSKTIQPCGNFAFLTS